MSRETQLIVHGEVDSNAHRAVRTAAGALGVPLAWAASPADLGRLLETVDPLAAIVSLQSEGAFEACRRLQCASMAHVPLLGLTERRDELGFFEFLTWGGDDLVEPQPASLLRRLRPLDASPQSRAAIAAERPLAIVAGPNPDWRGVVARSLVRAGFSVDYASNAQDVVDGMDAARFVVAVDDLAPAGAIDAVRRARQLGSRTPWVLVTTVKQGAATRALAARVEGVAVVDALSPPENALFAANELASPRLQEARTDPRATYDALVHFRVAGRDSDEVGFTYNVSAGGLYVRTLAPPMAGEEVWLELRAPRQDRRVRLGGIVAWRKTFSRHASALVPAGFGVGITSGMEGDLRRWREGCQALVAPTRDTISRCPSRAPSLLAPALV